MKYIYIYINYQHIQTDYNNLFINYYIDIYKLYIFKIKNRFS